MFKTIQSILPDNLKRSGMADKLGEARILALYKHEIGKHLQNELCARVRPLCLENGTVLIASLSDRATEILRSREEEIVKNVNIAAGQTVAAKIRLLT